MKTNKANYTQPSADMMALGFTGVAGFNNWPGYQLDLNYNYEHFWEPLLRVQNHMNGDDVIGTLSEGGGNWGYGKQEVRLKTSGQTIVEQQHYKSFNKELAVGYVRNRSFNIYTKGCFSINFLPYLSDPIYYILTDINYNDLKKKKEFVVDNLLSKTKYYIDWYSFEKGNHLKTDYIKTKANGNLKLEFPELTTFDNGNLVVWYVVHQYAYSGMKQNEAPMESDDHINYHFQSIENDTNNISFTNAIFPSPFQNTITVNSLEDDEFILKATSGEILRKIKINKGINQLNLGELSTGVYFAELKNQGFIIKLIRL